MKTLLEPNQVAIQQPSETRIHSKRYSISQEYGVSDYGKYLLVAGIMLILCRFLPGADLGPIKIPNVLDEQKLYCLAIGIVLLLLYIGVFIAWFKHPVEAKGVIIQDAEKVDSPVGILRMDHEVRQEGIEEFIYGTSNVRWFSDHFHGQYKFKNMSVTWAGNGPSGARGSLVFNILENNLLRDNMTLIDYADGLYVTGK